VGVGLKGDAPYRECATNGWALDGDGRPLSKSLGNGVAPEEIIKQYGAELLRLWSASVEFNEDVRISPLILTRLTEAYRKLRNTFRYILGNLSGFSHEIGAVSGDELLEIDQWILFRAEDLVRRCRAFYDDFQFHKVYRAVYDFAAVDLSNVYFDVLKDRLYTSAPKSVARRSAQTALYRIGYALVRLMAPVLTFTAEEVWPHLGEKGSVHTAFFPAPEELSREIPDSQRERASNWDRLMLVRDEVLKALETARQDKFIGAPLEARVVLASSGETYRLLNSYSAELPGLFIVSQVELQEGGAESISVEVARASGTKCERCWKYTEDVGSSPKFPTVCAFCASVLDSLVGDGEK
jgi:isoleucyl-tRNA synthetase